ncbi:hypothetical protein WKI71_16905 [Streptomyces sp. MS1.AVA.1]|uniref:Uncharacterized protein n=1 Tax=Streptomyces machairae TaxID=3134109 RepID=A0ABU8ULV4_9ACTN
MNDQQQKHHPDGDEHLPATPQHAAPQGLPPKPAVLHDANPHHP